MPQVGDMNQSGMNHQGYKQNKKSPSYKRSKPKSSIAVNIAEFKHEMRQRSMSLKKAKINFKNFKSLSTKRREDVKDDTSSSKFQRAFQKRSLKVRTIVKGIRAQSKQEKM